MEADEVRCQRARFEAAQIEGGCLFRQKSD